MNRLKELRQLHGYTLDDIEEKTGIKRGTFNNYESGKTEPKLITWIRLADFFGVSVGFLQGTESEDQEAEFLMTNFKETYVKKINETISKIEDIRSRISKISVNETIREDLNTAIEDLNIAEDILKNNIDTINEKGVEQFFKDRNIKSTEAQNKKSPK